MCMLYMYCHIFLYILLLFCLIVFITPRLRRGRVIGPVCVSDQKILKTLAKEPFRQKDGLKADIYATCRITFTFMSAVVLETALSTIYSATSYYSLHVQHAVFFRVLPCVIAASVYYAVFFRVRLLLRAYYDRSRKIQAPTSRTTSSALRGVSVL